MEGSGKVNGCNEIYYSLSLSLVLKKVILTFLNKKFHFKILMQIIIININYKLY